MSGVVFLSVLATSCGSGSTAEACTHLAPAFELQEKKGESSLDELHEVSTYYQDAAAAEPDFQSLREVSEFYVQFYEDLGSDVLTDYPDQQRFLDVAQYMEEECGLVFSVFSPTASQ